MSTSSLSPASTSTAVASAATALSPARAFGLASTAVGLSAEAGVIVMLGGAAPTGDSVQQLYTALAANAPSAVSAGAAASSTGATADTTSVAAGTDANADWSSILKSEPSLAPLVDRLSVQQALVNGLV